MEAELGECAERDENRADLEIGILGKVPWHVARILVYDLILVEAEWGAYV